MFTRSAAVDTLQGRAIQNVNKRWGEDFRKWIGRETIGIPVCKKKYSPFTIVKKTVPGTNMVHLTVQRMYGCHCHSQLRKKVIARHGERKGWEPFGQWSIAKAKTIARRAMEQINMVLRLNQEDHAGYDENVEIILQWKQICHKGSCAWKIKSKYDDVSNGLNQESLLKSYDTG